VKGAAPRVEVETATAMEATREAGAALGAARAAAARAAAAEEMAATEAAAKEAVGAAVVVPVARTP